MRLDKIFLQKVVVIKKLVVVLPYQTTTKIYNYENY